MNLISNNLVNECTDKFFKLVELVLIWSMNVQTERQCASAFFKHRLHIVRNHCHHGSIKKRYVDTSRIS
jgi:hypothetical protein